MAKVAKVAKKRRGRPPGSGKKKIADAIPTAAENNKTLNDIKEALQQATGPDTVWEHVPRPQPTEEDKGYLNSLDVEMKRSRNAQDEAICRALHEQAEANRKLSQALHKVAGNIILT